MLPVFSVGQNKADFGWLNKESACRAIDAWLEDCAQLNGAICCFRQFYFLPEGNTTHRQFLADKFPRRLNRFAMQEKEIITFFSYQIASGKLLEQERIILSRISPCDTRKVPVDRLETGKNELRRGRTLVEAQILFE